MRQADRLPTFRERQQMRVRQQTAEASASTKGKQKADRDDHADLSPDGSDKFVQSDPVPTPESSAWGEASAGGVIVWTGSWDRDVGMLNVDTLLEEENAALTAAPPTSLAARVLASRHLHHHALPSSSLPSHLGLSHHHNPS
jgi:hypothetical protein